ncbi:hypothetical protein E4U44_004827 [Claviceps purpurea]|nr:hypothetical protein E4U44_004827 [Claviceps purpurea]
MEVKSVMCNQPFRRCITGSIRGGIDHLRGISKDRHPRKRPEARNFGNVSCSEDGAIIWCNDYH